VKSADHNRDAGGTERAGNIEGARILVRLYANQRNQPEVAVTTKPVEQISHIDARVRLINCLDGDRNIRSENLALCAIGCNGDGSPGACCRRDRPPTPAIPSSSLT
jgi:hypothetical protein